MEASATGHQPEPLTIAPVQPAHFPFVSARHTMVLSCGPESLALSLATTVCSPGNLETAQMSTEPGLAIKSKTGHVLR